MQTARGQTFTKHFRATCVTTLLVGVLCAWGCRAGEPGTADALDVASSTPRVIRVAAFNTALSRDEPGALLAAAMEGDDRELAAVAEILQRVRPDVVLLSEVDRDPTGELYRALQANYLGVSQNNAEPISYPFIYAPEVNTGEPSGVDLDRDGGVGGPGDAYGWGNYRGHYGLVLLSRLPIDASGVRGFRKVRWLGVDANVMPKGWYSTQAEGRKRLSSKTHVEVPVMPPRGRPVWLLISHPTPPVFDGPEDRNGRRNHDEIRFWIDRLDGDRYADDGGVESRIPRSDPVIVLGDLNADPHDGDSFGDAIDRLVNHPRLQDPKPTSRGAVAAGQSQGGLNAQHAGDPALDTADFPDAPPRGPGNLRVDYVLPSKTLKVVAAGVYWPAPGEPHAELVEVSDHRLVWVDLAVE